MTLLFSDAGEPDLEVNSKGHGRLEHRQVWVSGELEGYGDLPGLSSVVMVRKQVSRGGQEPVDSVQYAVSSRRELPPWEAMNLVRGHWSIENNLFHVKDDSFREDRQVLHCHHRGTVMSLFRNVAVTLLRGNCHLWSAKEPLTGRAQRLAARPITLFSVNTDFGKALTVRLTPLQESSVPVIIVFTDSPGLEVRVGRWATDGFPTCHCDACDEMPEEESRGWRNCWTT